MQFKLLSLFSVIPVITQTAAQCHSQTFDFTSSGNVLKDFDIVAGSEAALQYGQEGMTVSISESGNNVALQSKAMVQAPLTLTLTMKGTRAPGAVPCLAMWDTNTGEAIDLELTGGFPELLMLELFRKNKDDGYGTDIAVRPSVPEQPKWDWVFAPQGYDSSAENTYVLTWENDYISWAINGQQYVNYTRTSAPFVQGPLPIRLGLWTTDASDAWAGELDWKKTPSITSVFKSMSVECGVPNSASVGSSTIPSIASAESASGTALASSEVVKSAASSTTPKVGAVKKEASPSSNSESQQDAVDNSSSASTLSAANLSCLLAAALALL